MCWRFMKRIEHYYSLPMGDGSECGGLGQEEDCADEGIAALFFRALSHVRKKVDGHLASWPSLSTLASLCLYPVPTATLT